MLWFLVLVCLAVSVLWIVTTPRGGLVAGPAGCCVAGCSSLGSTGVSPGFSAPARASLNAVVDVTSAGTSAAATVDVVVGAVLTCAVGGGVASLTNRLVVAVVLASIADSVAGCVVSGMLMPLLVAASIGSRSNTAATSLNVVCRGALPPSTLVVVGG